MFGLFKRTKIAHWETDLLLAVFNVLPDPHSRSYLSQVKDGLLRGVLIGMSDIKDYVGFSYTPKVYKSYYDKNGRNYKIEGIGVYDAKSKEEISLTLYFSFGVINGYTIEGNKKIKGEISKVDVSNVRKSYIGLEDYKVISSLLSPHEKELINPAEVYLVVLNGKEYYHIRDTEDGDFLAIDIDKNVYNITQDPFEIVLIHKNLDEIL